MAYSADIQKILLRIQQSEMTEAAAYHAMADAIKDEHNREALARVADEIASQAKALETYTNKQLAADERKVKRYARMPASSASPSPPSSWIGVRSSSSITPRGF